MAVWQMVLYTFASFLALRSLVSLMSQHRKVHRRRFLAQEQARRELESSDSKTSRPRSRDAAEKTAGSAA
jgi:hypothetical protein